MDPATGYMIGGAIGAGAQVLGGIAANSGSSAQARANRNFQEMMFNQRYQKTTQDLRAAGLNPMLAYTQGPGSAPSGDSAQMQNVAEGVAATAQDMMRMRQEREAMSKQIEKTDKDIEVADELKKVYGAQAEAASASALQSKANAAAIAADLPRAIKAGKLNEKAVEIDAVLERAGKLPVISNLKNLIPNKKQPDVFQKPKW